MTRAAWRALRARIKREWRRVGSQLGACALCAARFRRGEHVLSGEIFYADGIVLYRAHADCWASLDHEPALRARIAEEGWRSLCGAGPDDVAGSA